MSDINPFVEVDYLEEARSRFTSQFEDKVVFDKYVQLLIAAQTELSSVFKDLMQLRSIDTATGAQLDILGQIVGQDRVLLNADFFEFFGFLGVDKANSFGDIDDPTVGSFFYDFGEPLGGNILLNDDTYRLFIKAKIYKNSTASSPEEFIKVINLIFGTTSTFVAETGNASINVLFGRPLTSLEKALLGYVDSSSGYDSRLIPKTVGVRINYGEFDGEGFFGFSDVPNAKGFGDLTGTYGYGLGYGLKYGDSDFGLGIPTWSDTFDGSEEYDGDTVFSSTPTYPNDGPVGGVFATLY
ncbi:hypothetical protein D3C85_732100 [compost metagenome]